MLSQVEPGEIRAALPASPPDEPEPFSAVLADLDAVLAPGLTHLAEPAVLRLLRDHRLEPAILASCSSPG